MLLFLFIRKFSRFRKNISEQKFLSIHSADENQNFTTDVGVAVIITNQF